jgi:hypothetical protein
MGVTACSRRGKSAWRGARCPDLHRAGRDGALAPISLDSVIPERSTPAQAASGVTARGCPLELALGTLMRLTVRSRQMVVVIAGSAWMLGLFVLYVRVVYCSAMARQFEKGADFWEATMRLNREVTEDYERNVRLDEANAEFAQRLGELRHGQREMERLLEYHRTMQRRYLRAAASPWRYAPPPYSPPPS